MTLNAAGSSQAASLSLGSPRRLSRAWMPSYLLSFLSRSAGQAFPCRRALVSAQALQGTPRTFERLSQSSRKPQCLKRLGSQQLSVRNPTVIGLARPALLWLQEAARNSQAFSSSRGTPMRVSRFSWSCCLGQIAAKLTAARRRGIARRMGQLSHVLTQQRQLPLAVRPG